MKRLCQSWVESFIAALLLASGPLTIVPARGAPTQAEIGAIRQSCRADYQANCAGVPTGGQAALACLQQHVAAVSQPCQTALAAIGGNPAEQPRPSNTAAAQQQPTPQQPEDSWPHTITVADGSIIVYQPQVSAWDNYHTLDAQAAVAITPAGQTRPILGTIKVQGVTLVDFDTRMVTFSEPHLVSSQFPTLDTERAARLEGRIRDGLAVMGPKRIPLDSVLLSLHQLPAEPTPVSLQNNPPAIFYSDRPSSLVVFDGEPVLAPVNGVALSVAVNTNWDVFFDPALKTWYLLSGGGWLAAPDYKGPWAAADSLPATLRELPADANFAEVRKSIPGRKLATAEVPMVFVSTVPAEIIVTTDPPALQPVAGTGLRRVTNTNAVLYQVRQGGRYYVLLSGRWFAAESLNGPWTFATPDLPADFSQLPATGPQATVLASVPGTAQAQEAIVQAGIPRQATLVRGKAELHVTYVGAPQFKPIGTTEMAYAVNTTFDVIRIGEVYYACWQGAWFKSSSPTGPWALADSVPPTIARIPPSHPLYPVTYVRVVSATPATVTYSYTAGYTMAFVTAGVVVYGTGWYYPPVVIPGPVPVYLPYPYSYAGAVRYYPTTGTWARGGTVYGPYGAASAGRAYNPTTGAYAQGAAVYGPNGGAGAWSAYNPSTGGYAHGSASWGPNGGTANASFNSPRYGVSGSTTQNANAYSRWGSSTVTGPNATVHSESGSNANGSAGGFRSSTGAEGAGFHGAEGNSGGVVKGAGGDVYAGANGNVYKHDSSGWSKWNDSGWNQVQKPAGTGGQGSGGRFYQPAATTSAPSSSQPTGARGNGATTSAGYNRTTATSSSEYGQLEHDRTARQQGWQRQQSAAGGGQRFLGGHGYGGFGGGGFRSGRFR